MPGPSIAAPVSGDERAPVHEVTLDVGGTLLSGLLAQPASPPRALVVALHGAGMRAGYFHGPADPATSLLSLAASCGYAALALDRPGYGRSAGQLPRGMGLEEQAECLLAAVTAYRLNHVCGAGVFLVGHSLGGKAALCTAARWTGDGLLGVDVSGISDRWAVTPSELATVDGRRAHGMHWGPPGLYPPGTFRLAGALVTSVPAREAWEMADWPDRYPRVAQRVRVPVRFTFAEHERWWRSDPQTVQAMTARLNAPLARSEHLAGAGHNISLGRAARSYHLRALAFLEECLALTEATAP
ncbi:alpha/beta fold hydrolase [Streptomyces sp. M2CJ-2]|uniref:alpha/beta hydrolase n=1 Tax=Streptomyces sp. M2CJ-2 TaxID=2803948 RepID=UPI0019264B76|nr:alpha/beta fold hydrolase [Streptomyces sp. M2CJ-2]MBL3669879.1 alpha/beta fold hydrolase [Streptomyces sp. M2CJ-2]